MDTITTTVLIIGGGATGTGLARDLSLRGIQCLLVEKRDINSGASGANHGLLHSGARYVASDAEAAIECREEGEILKRLAPQCIDNTGGFFVAVPGDNDQYIADFESMCARSAIPCRQISPAEAREQEPTLSDRLIAAYDVEDAAVDPFMLSLDNIAHAVNLGSTYQCNTRVSGFRITSHRITHVELIEETTGKTLLVEASLVVNASGAWAGNIAAMAGASINLLYSSGSLLITQNRLTTRVINRLRKPADSDILVPGGTVSVLGTTSVTIDDPDRCRPSVEEADRIINDARAMMPVLETTRYIRAYAGVRPLVLAGDSSDARKVSRGFSLIDHERDSIDNFVTITGGKLTTYRLMAEKTADLVCRKLGVDASCTTREVPLPPSSMGMWTEPGLTAKTWLGTRDVHDQILCECEMVSRSIIDNIIDTIGPAVSSRGQSMLTAIGLRSRVGKGPCQGGFCGLRVTSHLYDRGCVTAAQGTAELKAFVERRWRGFSPILWGLPAMQADLQEALYCGMMDMELHNPVAPDQDALLQFTMDPPAATGPAGAQPEHSVSGSSK